MNSWLSRFCTAWGSGTRSSLVVPTKVKACKSFGFTVKLPCVDNNEHLIDFVITCKHELFAHKIISMICSLSTYTPI